MVLSGEVGEFKEFDRLTGVEQAGYSVNLSVFDLHTTEKYNVQVVDGFDRLETLKQMRREKRSLDELRDEAAALKAELPAAMSILELEVLRFKGKTASYLTLVCRFSQIGIPESTVPATAAA
jgi:hypothetical protein